MMKNTTSGIVVVGILVACAVVAPLSPVSGAETGEGPVKVFILAGQSNMQGQGLIELNERRAAGYMQRGMSEEAIAEKRKGALENLIEDPEKANAYKHIVDKDGGWIVRQDVRVYYERGLGGLKKGGLTVGFGAKDDVIAPEFQFGHVMGDYYDEPVLLLPPALPMIGGVPGAACPPLKPYAWSQGRTSRPWHPCINYAGLNNKDHLGWQKSGAQFPPSQCR